MINIYTTKSIFGMKHIWKLLLFFTFMFSSQNVSSQIIPLAEGLKDSIVLTYNYNDSIYVVQSKRINPGWWNDYDSVTISCWNGKIWKHFPSIYLQYSFYLRSMAVYKDELYISGKFDTIAGIKAVGGIVKYNGEKWVRAAQDSVTFTQGVGLFTTNKYLFASGIMSIDSVWRSGAAQYDGKRWKALDTYSKEISSITSIGNSVAFKGELYAFCGFGKLENNIEKKQAGILIWNGNNWRILDSFPGIFGYSISTFEDNIVFLRYTSVNNSNVFGWNGRKLIDMSNGFPDIIKLNIIGKPYLYNANNNLYLYVDASQQLPGKRTYFYKWNGVEWQNAQKQIPDNITIDLVAATSKNILLFGPFKKVNGVHFNHVAKLANAATVNGKVFLDKNSNCTYEKYEKGAKDILVQLTPGPLFVDTDEAGNYSIDVDSGEYAIKLINKKYWRTTCPTTGNINLIAEQDNIYQNNNFAYNADFKAQDIRVTLTGSTGWRARQGFTENYTLCYENVGTTTASGKVSLLLDSNFTNFTSTPVAKSYTYPIVEWEFDNLEIGEKRCITFKARIDSATVNDSIQLIAAFEGGDGWRDSSYYDNIDTLKQRVVAAVDPNDKTSKPEGNITKNTKELRYQIRFQNMGTDTAYRVTVIDTIDTNLPLTKVMMNSASHKYKLDIKNNVFKWTFDGIMLPDNKINEPLSHGFINYTAQIKQGLAIGTEIKNMAYIYFDYQKPVITNTARSKMVEEPVSIRENKTRSISSDLHIWPNPASKHIYINNEGKTAKELRLVNVLGQVLKSIKIQPFEIQKLQVEYLQSGIYFICLPGEKAQKLIIE